MHDAAFYLAAAWLTLLLVACAALVLRSGSTATRILALDTLVLVLTGLLILYAGWQRAAYFLDAALIVALLGFVGTLAAARFYGRGRLFS